MIGLFLGFKHLCGDLDCGNTLLRVVEEEAFLEELFLEVFEGIADGFSLGKDGFDEGQDSEEQLVRTGPPDLTIEPMNQLVKQPTGQLNKLVIIQILLLTMNIHPQNPLQKPKIIRINNLILCGESIQQILHKPLNLTQISQQI